VDPQKPENMAATIYQTLGLPQTIAWKDSLGRPHHVYHGEPIRRLTCGDRKPERPRRKRKWKGP
jgi:hypothetical protein